MTDMQNPATAPSATATQTDRTTPAPTPRPTIGDVIVRVDALPHGWQVLATILLGGAIAATAYGLSQLGWLELVSTFMTAFALALGRMLMAGRPVGDGTAFAGTRGMLQTVRDDVNAFVTTRPALAKVFMALGYALVFIAARSAFTWVLGVLSNVWFAVALGLIVAAAVASPVLFKAAGGSLAKATHGEG